MSKDHKKKGPIVSIPRVIHEDAPLYGCWINQDWKTAGFAYLVVARKMPTGLLMFASLWLDTVKKNIENCKVILNFTEDAFRQKVLTRDNISFFAVDLELCKEILSDVVLQYEARDIKPPDEFTACLKLIGSLEKQKQTKQTKESEHIEKKIESDQQSQKTVRFSYHVANSEMIETEIRQMPGMQEDENSTPERRQFIWTESSKKGLLKGQNATVLATILLAEETLVLDVLEMKKADSLNHTLLQYLGTTVVAQEK